jgi:hypothetical protein
MEPTAPKPCMLSASADGWVAGRNELGSGSESAR